MVQRSFYFVSVAQFMHTRMGWNSFWSSILNPTYLSWQYRSWRFWCRPSKYFFRKDFNPIVCSPCTFQVCTLEKPLSDLDSASMPNIYTKITSLKVCTVKICIYKILKRKKRECFVWAFLSTQIHFFVKFMVVREISPSFTFWPE